MFVMTFKGVNSQLHGCIFWTSSGTVWHAHFQPRQSQTHCQPQRWFDGPRSDQRWRAFANSTASPGFRSNSRVRCGGSGS